jgi:hypothetical protein
MKNLNVAICSILLLFVTTAKADFGTGFIVGSMMSDTEVRHVPSDKSACLVGLTGFNPYSGIVEGRIQLNSHLIRSVKRVQDSRCEERSFLSCKRWRSYEYTRIALINDSYEEVSETPDQVVKLVDERCKGK